MAQASSRQHLLLALTVIAISGYLGFTYGYRPRAAANAALELRLENLRKQNAIAVAERDAGVELEERIAFESRRLRELERLVPSSDELPELLDLISLEAGRSGVDVHSIQPIGSSEEDYYSQRTYGLVARGSYHRIAAFLTRIASLPRVVTPVALTVRVHDDEPTSVTPNLEVLFAVETYILPPDESQNGEAE